MPKTYKASIARRMVNSLVKKAILLGVGPRGGHILTTEGRRTGRKRRVPVQLIERDGRCRRQPDRAAPILRDYLEQVPVVGSYFDVTAESPTEDFVREAPQHPVFVVREP